MRIVSYSGREAVTRKLIRERRLRMQTTLQLLVASGVIRFANVESPSLGAGEAVALQPSEAADNVISASLASLPVPAPPAARSPHCGY
jgi:hypothetical protein